MAGVLARATYSTSEEDLQLMVMSKEQLPLELAEFEMLYEGALDNTSMAEQTFLGTNAESLHRLGRITGHTRGFGNTSGLPDLEVPQEFLFTGRPIPQEGTDLMAVTVAHLFCDEEAVLRWIDEVFVRQFQESVGKDTRDGQRLVSVEELEVSGFHDVAVGIKAVQEGSTGLVSSLVVDFRIGRLLGVAFVVTMGDFERRTLTEKLALGFERQVVRVVLGLT